MRKEKLKELMSKYMESINYYHNAQNEYNETECRNEYISPLLECFGWDVQNKSRKLPQYKDVVVEKFANSSERPDYTLTLNGVPKIFVEAKKPSVDIEVETSPALQIRRYGWNANHKLGILTNFENMFIYDTTYKPQKGDNAKTALYRKYNFSEYIDKYEEIYELISKESVYSGKFDEFIENNFQDDNRYRSEVDETFLKQINEWRLQLGRYLYACDDKYKDIDVLNDVVQSFINQIIFLRICEDRNLPLYAKLKEVAEDTIDLQNKLTKVFKEADKRYNSGLFKGENLIFDLKCDIIFGMIKSLYYPETPYMFNIIEPSILGKIYETFLTEHLVLADEKIELAKKNEYIYRSIVSTPVEIVKYMVKNTLEDICKGKEPCEILQLKIADIACGSGIFLEEAYQFLIDYCVAWYEINNPQYLHELSNGRKKLPLKDKKEILVNCIYGIDIDYHASEVSKFGLLIKLIEDENKPSVQDELPILPELSQNIFYGNALVENKDLPVACSPKEIIKLVPFDWDEEDKFDVILGNPPYVKTEDIHTLLGEIEFNIYKKKYKSAYKQFDKYFLFVEKALLLLKECGTLCYIIPNKFYKVAAGQELRKIVSNKIVSIDDFGSLQLFPDKTIYSSIVKIQNNESKEMKYTHVKTLASLWNDEKSDSIFVSNNKLGNKPWFLTEDIEFMKMINRLEKSSVSLVAVANIFNGIQTSAERPEKFSAKKEVYWFNEECVVSEDEYIVVIQKYGKEYKIEKKILKPYFKPTKHSEKGMSTYSMLETDKRIIFPYDEKGNLIDIGVMQKDFSGCFEYLTDCYDRLVPKVLNNGIGRDIPRATENTWYQYGRTQALTAFINTPKLIVRVLSKKPMYAYDKEDMLIASGGTAGYCAITEKKDAGYALEFIQAWLMHPYTQRMIEIMGSDFENEFTARGTFLLGNILIASIDFSDVKQKNIYDMIIEYTRKIYQLNENMKNKSDKATVNVLRKEKDMLINKIENLITKIYQQDFR